MFLLFLPGISRAAELVYSLLDEGVSSVDAVQRGVMLMEDDPTFDAGVGCVELPVLIFLSISSCKV